MERIVIFGTGGFGREVHELIEDMNRLVATYQVVGFLDDEAANHGNAIHELPVLGDSSWLISHPGVRVVVGVGNPKSKFHIVSKVRSIGGQFESLIHPTARVGTRTQLGEGTIICSGNHLTTDIRIGSFVTLNLNDTVGHDTTIEDFVTCAPGVHLSGNVQVGAGTDIGTGAVIIQGISIGEWSILGAGSSVINPIPANVTAVGVPAKVIKTREAGWQLR